MSESSAHSRPVIRIAIGPRAGSDFDRFQHALRDIAQEDPTVGIKIETSGGQSIISGMSELHLAAICDRISHQFQIQIDAGQPKVIYLETVSASSEAEGKYMPQGRSSGAYGHVKLRIVPNEPGKGFEFINDIQGGVLPGEFIKPTEQGVREALSGGVLTDYEIVDVKVSLYDGSYRDVDSSDMAFKIAGSMAFKEAARKARPILLEPIMAVEVIVREDDMGMIIDDLNSRRGRIEGMENRAGWRAIKASVPLSEMIGYAADLSAGTKGTGNLFVRFARYEAVRRRPENWGDQPGITANRPNRPRGSIGSVAAGLDEEFP